MELTGNGSVVSSCGKFRYLTWTALGDGSKGVCMIVTLMPVPADPSDATFRACRDHAIGAGYSTLVTASLFAVQAIDPNNAAAILDPVGPENDKWTREAAQQADLIIVAWGDFPRIGPRVNALMQNLKEFDLYSIQNNRNGTPAHPLAWRLKAPKIYRQGTAPSLPVAG